MPPKRNVSTLSDNMELIRPLLLSLASSASASPGAWMLIISTITIVVDIDILYDFRIQTAKPFGEHSVSSNEEYS